jgi:hypothetical protein
MLSTRSGVVVWMLTIESSTHITVVFNVQRLNQQTHQRLCGGPRRNDTQCTRHDGFVDNVDDFKPVVFLFVHAVQRAILESGFHMQRMCLVKQMFPI